MNPSECLKKEIRKLNKKVENLEKENKQLLSIAIATNNLMGTFGGNGVVEIEDATVSLVMDALYEYDPNSEKFK